MQAQQNVWLSSPIKEPYVGISSAEIQRVYSMALRFRFTSPTADTIINKTRTSLDAEIVASLIEAAVRLIPADNSPQGLQLRQEKNKQKNERAKLAESTLIAALPAGPWLDEDQQNKLALSPTPDVRFSKPTIVFGVECHWIEYKNFFGFKKNPFVASKNKRQYRKYVTELGPGIVVYRLGFEVGLLDINGVPIDGVRIFREKEFLTCLDMVKN